jgi:hypothetical protein
VSSRQSDRDMPKTPFNHGVTCLTRLTGQEFPGLVMLTMVCLDRMLPSRNMTKQNLIMRFSHLLWLTLYLNVFLNKPEKTESEVDNLEGKTIKYLSLYRKLVGPQREMKSRCGLQIVNMHALTHFAQQYRHFGNTATYFGVFFESCIKKMAKQNMNSTLKKHANFLEELMMCYYERQLCKISGQYLDHKFPSTSCSNDTATKGEC